MDTRAFYNFHSSYFNIYRAVFRVHSTIASLRNSDFLVGGRNFCRPEEGRTMKKKKKNEEQATRTVGRTNTGYRREKHERKSSREQKGVKAKLARVWRVQRREIKGRTNAVRELDVIQSRSVVPS